MSEYVIQATEGVRGDVAIWWRANRQGYTTDLDQAGIYTEKEAVEIECLRGTDVKHRIEDVDGVAHRVVDLLALRGTK